MRVMIADDAVLFREGLGRVLEAGGIQVAGQVGDAERLLALVRADRPDAVVVDIRMPPTHTREGLDAAQRIRAEHPQAAVEGGDAVGQAAKARAVGVGAADAVVAHLDQQLPFQPPSADADGRGMGVLGGVGKCL